MYPWFTSVVPLLHVVAMVVAPVAVPETMRAAQYAEYIDDSKGISVSDGVAVQVPVPGQLLIEVAAAAMNPIDWKVMAGYLHPHWPAELPFTMGYDFAGVVAKVGGGASSFGFKVGDRVFGCQWGDGLHADGEDPIGGAFAEFILVPARKVIPMPKGTTFVQAAALPLVGLTSFQLVHEEAKVVKDQVVLVLGGTTAVGQLAIQQAFVLGAQVFATCSAKNADFVRRLGAKPLDYHATKWWESAKGFDVVLDTVGDVDDFAAATSSDSINIGGKFISIANFVESTNHLSAWFHAVRIDRSHLQRVAADIAGGKLILTINNIWKGLSTASVQDMVATQKFGRAVGKNVLTISSAGEQDGMPSLHGEL